MFLFSSKKLTAKCSTSKLTFENDASFLRVGGCKCKDSGGKINLKHPNK